MMQNIHVDLNLGLPCEKQHSRGRKLFHQQIGIKFKEEAIESYVWTQHFMVLKLGHLGK
jgi:hypothetical protein